MSQKVLDYLKKRLPLMTESDIEDTYRQAEQVYEREDGALGVTRIKNYFWRVVFFAADSKKTRNELIRQALQEHPECQVFVYERMKHDNKPFYHAIPYLKRLLAI
jgi:hypothetical protein